MGTRKTYETGSHIFPSPTDRRRLGLIVGGSITLYRTADDGRRLTLNRLQKGDVYIGLEDPEDLGENQTLGEVTEVTTIDWLSTVESTTWIKQNPLQALEIMHQLNRETERTRAVLESVAFKDSSKRTAALLIALGAEHEDQMTGDLTQQEMAEMIGVSRETVSRSLSSLRKAGVIETSRKKITIKDIERLRDLAA